MISFKFFKSFGCGVSVALWLILAGCSGMPSGEGSGSFPVAETPSSGQYRLQSGDEIDLQIYREPQLSGAFRIDAGGSIRHPLVGPFSAGGKTVEEVEAELTAVLREKYLVNPRVMVSITVAQSSHVVILGEVKNPGVQSIPFGGAMTLLQAIAEAGGFTDLANVNRVTVTRTVDGDERSIRARISRMISGQDPDLKLEPNDVIMVPEILF